jgi:hypothetical protein
MKTMHLVKEEFRGAPAIRNVGHGAALVVGHGATFILVSAVCLVTYLMLPWVSQRDRFVLVEWSDYAIGFVARSALIAFGAATAADAGIRWCWGEDSRIRIHRTVVMSALGMLFLMAGIQYGFRVGDYPTDPMLPWRFVKPMLCGVAAALVVSAKMQLSHLGSWLRRVA